MINSEKLFKLFLIVVAMFSLSQISKGENIEAIYNQDNSIHENSIQEFEKSISENIVHPKSSNFKFRLIKYSK